MTKDNYTENDYILLSNIPVKSFNEYEKEHKIHEEENHRSDC